MPNKQLRCQVSVRIFGEEKCFGPGVADLLERVDRLHSLADDARIAAVSGRVVSSAHAATRAGRAARRTSVRRPASTNAHAASR